MPGSELLWTLRRSGCATSIGPTAIDADPVLVPLPQAGVTFSSEIGSCNMWTATRFSSSSLRLPAMFEFGLEPWESGAAMRWLP
jgi:hypothetical protein